VYFERPSHKISPHFATNILADAIDERLTPASKSCLVVVELKIFRDK